MIKNLILSALTLWKREVVRFYRQPSRVIGALATPLVFWLLIGSGVGNSFKVSGENYLEYFYPGILLMILLFTSIFSTISLIEDRREGFLQSVLVAPVSEMSFILGKILGSTTLACFQAVLFLLLAPWAGVSISIGGWLAVFGTLFLSGFALSTLGFFIAWQFKSIQGFHAIMNILIMPLWFVSGSFFPRSGASSWIQVLMDINPLTYGLGMIRESLYGVPAPENSFMIVALCGVTLFVFCALTVKHNQSSRLV